MATGWLAGSERCQAWLFTPSRPSRCSRGCVRSPAPYYRRQESKADDRRAPFFSKQAASIFTLTQDAGRPKGGRTGAEGRFASSSLGKVHSMLVWHDVADKGSELSCADRTSKIEEDGRHHRDTRERRCVMGGSQAEGEDAGRATGMRRLLSSRWRMSGLGLLANAALGAVEQKRGHGC